VSGDAARAISARFGWLPSHCTVYGQVSGNGFLFGRSSRSATSAMPKKFTIAAAAAPKDCECEPLHQR